MNVLVAYASKRGSTEEIARAIAETLRDAGLDVDCLRASDVGDLDRLRRRRPRQRRLHAAMARRCQALPSQARQALARRPFWVFSSGPVGQPGEDNLAWLEPAKIIAQAERLGARGHVVFGGRVPAEPMDRSSVRWRRTARRSTGTGATGTRSAHGRRRRARAGRRDAGGVADRPRRHRGGEMP